MREDVVEREISIKVGCEHTSKVAVTVRAAIESKKGSG